MGLLLPMIGGRIHRSPGVFTGLGGLDVAEKLPVIIDNRADNTAGNARHLLLLWLCVEAGQLPWTTSSGMNLGVYMPL